MKIAAASLNQIPFDFQNNRSNILQAIKAAQAENVNILCLPELCICGYGCEDGFYYPHIINKCLTELLEIASFCENITVAIGLPLYFENKLYNCACLIEDRKILGFAAKRNLARDGVHYEPRWFNAWPGDFAKEITVNNQKYPIGSLIFKSAGYNIGFEICEDAWVENRPGLDLLKKQVQIILSPSASHAAFSKRKIREKLITDGSKKFNTIYVYANLLGNENGRVIFDGDTIIAKDGKIVASGKRFSYSNFILTTFDNDNRKQHLTIENWENKTKIEYEEFSRLVSLGLFDYLRKSKLSGFVVSLSGGADSAAVSVLVYLMTYFGCKELGLANFLEKLNLKFKATSEKEIVKQLLLCVYQSTENSSATTKNAAKKLAEEINASFHEIDVNKIYKDYVTLIENAENTKLTWQNQDLALQNIQSRVRSPAIWMFANLRNALLLVTSNRSEAAVGYATMDGDTSGSLAPIAGVDKNFIRNWLKWLETTGLEDRLKFSNLKFINEQQPTAELRPLSEQQTDEQDLMPYELLAFIEKEFLEQRKSPDEIIEAAINSFPNFPKQLVNKWVDKFFALWTRNQWKRERFAPSFQIDTISTDPKGWCRFPILSKSFK